MEQSAFIWPVIMVSPTPGENPNHLTEAVWLGGAESLEGTTDCQSEGFTGSTLSVLVLVLVVTAGAAGWEGTEGEAGEVWPLKCQ